MAKDSYRFASVTYDIFVEPFNRTLRKIALKMFPPQNGLKVLEVGCGTGTNLLLYQQKGCNAAGIDLSPNMLKVARRKLGPSADIRLGDAADMPFANQQFDLAIAMLTLHEMPPAIRGTVLSEIKRTLKPEGRLLLIDFHPGPYQGLKGLITRAVILFFELSAGKEHYRNQLDFLAGGGLPALIAQNGFKTESRKIVGGGNLGFFLVKLK